MQEKILYVVYFIDDETNETWYRSGLDDFQNIWDAEFFETKEAAQEDIDNEVVKGFGKREEYFIKEVKLSY